MDSKTLRLIHVGDMMAKRLERLSYKLDYSAVYETSHFIRRWKAICHELTQESGSPPPSETPPISSEEEDKPLPESNPPG